MRPLNVLIVSASAGTGHTRAAEAVRAAYESSVSGVNAVHVDILDLAPRWVRSLYGTGFEKLAAHAPRVWREIYRFADGEDADRARWAETARRVLFREFEKLLRSRRWDHAISTHFLPAQLAAGRIQNGPRFTIVVTDFTLHRYWVQPGVGHYCVAAQELAEGVRRRLPNARVLVTGIPIDARFCRSQSPAPQADRPVVLIAGGGLGIGVEESVHTCLVHAPANAQIVAVCGRNDAARSRLSRVALPRERLSTLGYVRDMERLMAAADLIVTKPGGLTCSEALAMGKPLILTRPIPGHEEGNVRYLTGVGAALKGCTNAELAVAVRLALHNDRLRMALTAAAQEIGKPNSAAEVGAAVASLATAEAAA